MDFLEPFDSAKVPFYEGEQNNRVCWFVILTISLLLIYIIGCMIVELLDYRPTKGKDPVLEKPDRTRVVLTPSPETLWADLCLLNQRAGLAWTDKEAVDIESRILVSLYCVVTTSSD